MKYTTTLNYFLALVICCFTSCKKDVAVSESVVIPEEEPKQIEFLPFTEVNLNDLSSFKPTTNNWQIAGNAVADRLKERTLTFSEGTGVLINTGDKDTNGHIFSSFEHGDIEIELDVMMPVKSNSGLYFQGRYEVQLFDSWGIKEPQYSDIGGIYQRWDGTRGQGKEGFEGQAPKTNAAKAPGLWQHFKIIFHAPKFDATGNKIKNAWFEEVWLNGVLIQSNVEVSGPTQAAAFENEKPKGALMIQGDHGPVAIKNIQYKLYEDKKFIFSNIVNKEFEGNYQSLINMDSIKLVSEKEVKNIDLSELALSNSRKIVSYSGTMDIPSAGDYLFGMGLNGGGLLLIDNDTIFNLNEDYGYEFQQRFAELTLQKGSVPFVLVYNKKFPWRGELDLKVEGPGIQKYSLLEPITDTRPRRPQPERILIEPKEGIIAQRTFIMHKDIKKVFSISVGSPIGVHYAFDLSRGSLLMAWDGQFLDATPMWDSRGESQLVEPNEFHVASHGGFEFAYLESDDSNWPSMDDDIGFKQLGYEFNQEGIPMFLSQINGTNITNTFKPSGERKIERNILVNADKTIWHKLAEGEHIESLPNNTYIINDESYYVEVSGNSKLKPIIRNINGMDELIVKIPTGKQAINYSIIW
ncbi:3-keto-disaccharide hydrolase [Confluentibacter citreus]|uniref:3-keto-disaccharide hydrolase n=1 Tax=Confluentibacter citreus TaxID=2007307 RepID=UPI000C288518|nr:DUF1080 domain-containing protein [Confluentibacter citreus]